ncbi:DUF2971 domain-containing protein [Acinetobacter sp. YH12041]|uniref:DUF2971 domain-containing protein n=1 Tax=Acinetobacter sp. YH12041 TaxID=2601049 RepID=UPI0015D3BFE3|nr:DUF2971 domain-containing protein [Acinetobacter sp. YH12041]
MSSNIDNFSEQNITLWRYMDLSKFLDMLINQHIVLARPDLFEDVYEAYPHIYREALKTAFLNSKNSDMAELIDTSILASCRLAKFRTYVSCWHKNSVESSAMWKLYCKNEESLVIKTTIQKLKSSLTNPKNEYVDTLNYGHVVYDLNLSNLTKTYTDLVQKEELISININDILLSKRPSFEHEKEFRLVGSKKHKVMEPSHIKLSEEELKCSTPAIQLIPCNLNQLIEEIIVAPNTPSWFFELIKNTVIKLGYSFSVTQSNLYKLG